MIEDNAQKQLYFHFFEIFVRTMPRAAFLIRPDAPPLVSQILLYGVFLLLLFVLLLYEYAPLLLFLLLLFCVVFIPQI